MKWNEILIEYGQNSAKIAKSAKQLAVSDECNLHQARSLTIFATTFPSYKPSRRDGYSAIRKILRQPFSFQLISSSRVAQMDPFG